MHQTTSTAHRRAQSIDSTFNIRRNPLNIRNLDGTDLVMDGTQDVNAQCMEHTGVVKQGHAKPTQEGIPRSLRRPESAIFVSSQEHHIDEEPEYDTTDPEFISYSHLIKTGATPPSPTVSTISDKSVLEQRKLDLHLGTPDNLTGEVMKGFSSLTRKGTITSTGILKEDLYLKTPDMTTENAVLSTNIDHNSQASATSRASSLRLTSTVTTESVKSEEDTKDQEEVPEEDPEDRGRLFLKFSGLRDVKLPLNEEERPKFSMVLDNGIQCVETYPIAFGDEIDQEFELVVGHELQLVVTLVGYRTVVDQQAIQQIESVSHKPSYEEKPVSAPKKKKKLGFLTSPKKKKKAASEAAAAAAAAASSTVSMTSEPVLELPKRKDVWKNMVGPRNEFGRALIHETRYEHQVFGQAKTFTIPCFSDWAKGDTFKVCGLEVTMMYIPKMHRDEQLPLSLEQAEKELEMAHKNCQSVIGNYKTVSNGYLSQQGGGCSFWRRRWFELKHSKLLAHHDESKQLKQTIDCTSITKVVDSKEDPSVYEELGFKLVFDDGDNISLLADSKELKNAWVEQIKKAMDPEPENWMDLVMKHERKRKDMLTVNKQRSDPLPPRPPAKPQGWQQRRHKVTSSFVERL